MGKVHPIERHTLVNDKIHQKPKNQNQACHHIARYGDGMSQFIELFVKRGLYLVIDLGTAIYLTPLGGIAHTFHYENAIAIDDRGATADVIGGIGSLMIELLFPNGLLCHRLASQRRLVDLQGYGLNQGAIGGDFVAWVDKHHVAYHHILSLDSCDMPVAHHRHLFLVFRLVQDVELMVGAQFEDEAHRGCQHHCDKDTKRLQQDFQTNCAPEILIHRHHHRQCQGDE